MKFAPFALALATAYCASNHGPSGIDAGADLCQRAEDRIHELGCVGEHGRPLWRSPKGTPFAEICRRSAFDWHPARIIAMASCDQLEDAFRGAP